ncbi:probable G-protein coupled receptor 132b [Poeciliopsis prolifica]|uniref:probable G-protein coupled receptor 132b n=1 Tax=Poeciliopsis prolifica TaxID=188132 RepID=UPI002414332E|nr:probable G-protein coupled receptor 132b [Poeciliopsis prolifica]
MLNVTGGLSVNQSAGSCVMPYGDDRVPLLVLYIVVLVVGLPANALTLFLTWQQVRRKNVLGVYLWSLSLCDLTYLFTLPLWADYVNSGHQWRWSSTVCKLTGYIFFTNMYISIFLLCCISCDRYWAVVYSLESRGQRRLRHAVVITVVIVLVVSVGHSAVFTMKEGKLQDSKLCFEPSQRSVQVMGFSYARFVIGFLLPLLLLAVTNRCVLTNVQRSTGLHGGQKRRVRRLAVAVVLLFLVCFGPYHLILLARAVVTQFPQLVAAPCLFEGTMYTPYTMSLGLSTINSAVNPILYVLSSNNIRKDCRRGLTQICAWFCHGPSTNSSQIKSLELNAGTDTERHPVGPEETR